MATYYINAGGDNANDGLSSANAFANFDPVAYGNKAALTQGDTVIVEDTGGDITHSSQVSFWGMSGSSGSPITIEAADGHSPVIDFTNATAKAFYMEATSYFVIDGLEVKNAGNYGFQVYNANNNTFKNCYTHHHGYDATWGSGIAFEGGGSGHLVQNCKSAYGQAEGNADGFALDGGASATFENCDAWHNADDGFDAWDGGVSTFTDCRAWHNGHDENGTVTGNGNGFKLGGDTATGDGGHTLERCIAFKNSGDSGRGFDDNNADNAITFHNCTAWDNDVGWRVNVQGVAHVLRNCIEYQNTTAYDSMANADDQYNTWNLSINDPDWADVSLTNDSKEGPANESTFMTLNSTSSCIDAGTDVGLSYNGSDPDLGAIEYTATVTQEDSLYNNFKELLFNGGVDLDTDTIRVALISDSPAYGPDVDTEVHVSDVLDGGTTASEVSGTGYSRQTISLTATQDNANDVAYVDTGDLTYSGIDAGTIDGVLIYKDGPTDDTDSPLIAYLTSDQFPLTTNGGDVTIQWGSSGVLELS